MISFIDEHRGVCGVEPICRLLPIALSTYYENVAKRLDVDRLSVRARSDIGLKIEIRRGLRTELPRLWRSQGLAAIAARGRRRRPLHCRPAYEVDEPARCHSGKADPHDVLGQVGPEPA